MRDFNLQTSRAKLIYSTWRYRMAKFNLAQANRGLCCRRRCMVELNQARAQITRAILEAELALAAI